MNKLEFHRTYPVCTEPCQWTELNWEFSTITSLHYGKREGVQTNFIMVQSWLRFPQAQLMQISLSFTLQALQVGIAVRHIKGLSYTSINFKLILMHVWSLRATTTVSIHAMTAS